MPEAGNPQGSSDSFSTTQGEQASQPPEARRRTGPKRKLDAAAKHQICLLLARGHTLAAAAKISDISYRTIYREQRRDAFFRQQINEQREGIAELCLNSLRTAAPENFRAAMQLYKLTYPDRYHYKPDTTSSNQYEAWTTEILNLFESIATPEQMRELNRKVNKMF
jgi:hypothetical protein